MEGENVKVVGKCLSVIDGEVVPRMILGVSGRTYHGREVVVYAQEPGLFGTDPSRRGENGKVQELTLSNGILNPCQLREPPTCTWAVIDAASQLKTGFSRSELVDKAVGMLGEEHRSNLTKAWKAIKIHHKWMRVQSGITFMVDTLPHNKIEIRARHADETVQYFEDEPARKTAAEEAIKILEGIAVK